ncbi:cation-dependent mannose-6-phosphate receptor isoform X1 [Lingula anatina]|uniref:Cation-dependent mannose-6-phosphate receptor isoform X1 n=1 Tax=Lingula anatina TaxID=7574 RepID=A0A1S3HX94_LINAN|nr:cation-dependent mannose-6-phosphate receptor isoform X1 [Lingula anatina]|eukprot:XP_013390628.1 cation-dependent mannose-6-phosphate receptor isoform X1 [Lingula anatina]
MQSWACDTRDALRRKMANSAKPASRTTLRGCVFLCVVWLTVGAAKGQTPQKLDCKKAGPCTCNSANGVIDLTPLANSDNTPRFKDVPGGGDSFSWNPCNPFDEGSGCAKVSACQNHAGTDDYPIGLQESAEFINDPTRGLEIHYTATTGFTQRESFVQLICDMGTEGSLTAKGEDPAGSAQYYMTLTSKYACPGVSGGGISAGSVLLIVFFSLVVVYILAGMAVMKFGKGAAGRELIPNYSFWKGLPFLIRDGIMFVVGGCKPKKGYDSI